MMFKECVFCHPELEPNHKIILSNEYCMFLQLEQAQVKGGQLEGAGLIVPKIHRKTAFDLTYAEWNATYTLLQKVKEYVDEKHQPQGDKLGWSFGGVGGVRVLHWLFRV